MKPIQINKTQPEPNALHTPYKGGDTEFDGDVTLKRLVLEGDSTELELLAVWFMDGARTRPHIHDVDQILHILEGDGIVADEKETLLVKAGDVVTVHAGEWHWHGAQPHRDMLHISIRKMGNSTNWDVELKNWASEYDKLT